MVQSFEPGEDWFWDYSTGHGVRGPSLAPPTGHRLDQTVPGPADRLPPEFRA